MNENNLYRIRIARSLPTRWIVKTYVVEADNGQAAVNKLFTDWVGESEREYWTVESILSVYETRLTDGIWFAGSE